MSWLRKIYFNLLYFRDPPWDTQISPPELLEFIAQNPPGRALDLGCGTGTNVITLAENGWNVTGVDYIQRAIRAAKKKIRQAGVPAQVIVGDVTKLEGIKGPFDLVLDIGCFHGLSEGEQSAYLGNLERLTIPGSSYLMYGFFRESDDRGPGMIESDLDAFMPSFDLLKRQEGTDRGQRRSVWLTFRKKPQPEAELSLGN
jgi:SAM-dependent methyltransferase